MIIILILFLIAFIVWISYWKLLLLKLNLYHIFWKKIKYFNRDYFNFINIYKYSKIIWFIFLYLLSVSVVFFLIFLVLFFIFSFTSLVSDFSQLWEENLFSILSRGLFFIFSLVIGYLLYRISFSYIIFWDNFNYKDKKPAKFYINESFRITSWYKKFIRFFIVVLTFSILLLPFNLFSSLVSSKYDNLNNYVYYYSVVNSWKQLSKKNFYSYNSLKLKYKKFSLIDINKDINRYKLYKNLLSIINYILIFWIFEMIFVSFYKNELIK